MTDSIEEYNAMSEKDKTYVKVTQLLVSANLTSCFNEDLKHLPFYRQGLKHKSNAFQKELVKYQVDYNKLDDVSDEEGGDVHNMSRLMEDFLNEFKDIRIVDLSPLIAILKEYKKEVKKAFLESQKNKDTNQVNIFDVIDSQTP